MRERRALTYRIATIASLSTFTPDANPAIQGENMYMIPKSSPPPPTTCAEIEEEGAGDHLKPKSPASQNRLKFIYRALGKIPTIASAVYRHRLGRNYNSPMPYSLNYCENILYMMDRLNEPNYVPDARLVKILDKLFILMSEHGVNCSTVMMRHLTSSGVDPYTALSGAGGALFGERKRCSSPSLY